MFNYTEEGGAGYGFRRGAGGHVKFIDSCSLDSFFTDFLLPLIGSFFGLMVLGNFQPEKFDFFVILLCTEFSPSLRLIKFSYGAKLDFFGFLFFFREMPFPILIALESSPHVLLLKISSSSKLCMRF